MIADRITAFFIAVLKQALTQSIEKDIDDLREQVIKLQSLVLEIKLATAHEDHFLHEKISSIERELKELLEARG